jgi:hypothetical protein
MATTATGPDVAIYYTTDGTDPRVMFTSAISPNAKRYTDPITLNATTLVKARMLTNSAWSALTEATFDVSQFGAALRFTEINYNPPGGDDYEFVELKNFSAAPINLSGMIIDGINFRFPDLTTLAPGAVIVIASSGGRTAFAQRYPGVTVAAYFSGASLNNGGERLTLKDRLGNIIASVDYHDDRGWPIEADGSGYTLELANRELDPNSPASWRKSKALFGSPGVYEEPSVANVVLNEVVPIDGATPAWVEIYNRGAEPVSLAKYSIGDLGTTKRYVFPTDATIAAGGYLVVGGLPIALTGGTVFLYDPSTNRLDSISFGRQTTGTSLARIDGVWTLGQPTSGAENIAATLAPSAGVVINEWFANPATGGDDWLELHNTGSAPVPLQGLTLSVSNAIYRIPTLSFIPAGGFVQLFAAERIGPDQLGFKLPAAGGTIRLYDANGAQVNFVTYTAQTEGVTEGRLPDGSQTLVKFRGSPSPGASNYLVNASAPIFINEIMAHNTRAIIDPMGGTADWIELYNAGDAIVLDGFSLSADEITPGQWSFPPGFTMQPDSYAIVWFDKTHPPTTASSTVLNTGKSLSADGGGVYLFNPQGQVVDQIEYGIQPTDLTIGRIGTAFTLLATPTPGAANSQAAGTASAATVRINEWAAGSDATPAWVELYNSNSLPVWIGTMSLTDQLNLAGQKKFILPNHSYLAPNQFARWTTSGNNSINPGEINFNISPFGEALRLYSSSLAIVDTVSFGMFPTNTTYARVPDAGATILPATPSPAAANYIAVQGVTINEVMPVPNKVELRNMTSIEVDVGGWTLSNEALALHKLTLPPGTMIAPWGYLVVTLPPDAQLDTAFGGTVVLARVLADGTVTGEQARLNFGPAVGELGYVPVRTFTGVQSAIAPGSIGRVNDVLWSGPLIISEIMYHPADDATAAEFIELYNTSATSSSAMGFRINGGVQFNFPPGYEFPPNAAVLLVHFDPADPVARAAFEARYRLSPGAALLGPLRGKLANEGDEIILERSFPETSRGYIPFAPIDRVLYSDQTPWPIAADGSGSSLQRIGARDFANEPLNWVAAAPSPLVFTPGEPSDRDVDGIPDLWEIAFGLDLFDAGDAAKDLDGDGFSNRAEFEFRTDPTDPKDAFMADMLLLNEAPMLRFNAAPGIIYRIEVRDSLSEGEWQTHSTFGPVDESTSVGIANTSEGQSQRFYRIVK